ncbi:serine hydrolase [Mucilaginibacter sp. SG564]|uniref:serine hydrolase domain-containing protein n=1 Tax=Mucilaginibacter sp. SG564 TaxID=2587022 RepID=UPI001553C68D|nr:serine hydrolase [Mucilaginibacter sp. SG564]NOW98422.1 CubicO group peptidase (beta-lactamase class C family) [Mucilaginibacter sp. SG564]
MRLITVLVTIVILTQAVTLNVSAQSISQNFDRYYKALYHDREMNGNIAVAEKGRVIYQQTFGLRDEANQKPNNEQTQFELASISKLFTATAILQLKEQGLLDLDTPFAHYFPEFPYPTITVRHLLAHTSGLPDIESVIDPLLTANPDKQFTIHDDLQNVLLYSRNHDLKFQPGEQWGYSSLGYHLLGLLVEKLSAQTLANYTRDHIFKVAGMAHSYVQTSMAQKSEANRAKNYQYNNHFEMKLQWADTLSDWREWTYNLALETGGGGIISTTEDMLRFDKALNAGILIKQKTFEEACTPYRLNNGQPAQPFDLTYCGLGWFIFKDTSCGKIIWGSGANPGTISFFASNINKNQCIVVLRNRKCNSFNDLKALDMLCGKAVPYHSSLAFTYAQDLYKNGRVYADARLEKLCTDTTNYIITESDLNRASLEFRRAGLKSQALAIAETHIKLFPKSTGAFKDYALTLAEYGQKEKAIAAYQKALELNPNDHESGDALNKLTGKTKP